jgi:hypothetical protein
MDPRIKAAEQKRKGVSAETLKKRIFDEGRSLKDALELSAADERDLRELACGLVAQGDFSRADACINALRGLFGEHPLNDILQAQCWEASGKDEEALAMAKKGAEGAERVQLERVAQACRRWIRERWGETKTAER